MKIAHVALATLPHFQESYLIDALNFLVTLMI